ncbi:transcriptional repressor [Dehalococcoidia bacterium]|nr:transcriptional repressor [Dehalococcoidia bacterium]
MVVTITIMPKDSKQKKAILSVLRRTTSHPSADWIYEEVRKVIPNISLGTVYRNLKVLKENGVILELSLAGASSRYDANCEDHYHFRCIKCGRVSDVDEPVNYALDEKVAGNTGSRILGHRLEFYGFCPDCGRCNG